MRHPLLITLLISATASAAAPRKLTLADAVAMALRVDPLVAEAHIGDARARLGVLRAQLDRFSFKVDGSVQELWNQFNIGGPPAYNCTIAAAVSFEVSAPSQCTAQDPTNPNAMIPGTVSAVSTSQWQGLTNFQAQLKYFAFSGFAVEATVKRAKLNQQAALVQIKQQRKDVALQVARQYWNVRRLLILRDVQQRALLRMIDAESIAAVRVKAGLAPPIDKNRAMQRKLTQQATLEDLQGQANAARLQLEVTLGSDQPLELVDDPEIPTVVPASPVELVREAWRRRPEIKNAVLQVDIQHQNVVVARSNFYPQLTLFGLFQYGNNQFNVGSGARSFSSAANPFGNMTGTFTAGAALTMNFFDTLNTYTATGDAWYQEQSLKQETRRFERLVDSDVRQAHANLVRLYQRRAPLIVARDVAADNLRIIEARYKNGDALIIEYLDAQIDLANAELNLADVTAQLQEQWLELQASLGFIIGVDHG